MRKDDDFEMLDLDNETYVESTEPEYIDENGEYYEEEYYEDEYYEDEYYEEEYVEPKPVRKKRKKRRRRPDTYAEINKPEKGKKKSIFWIIYIAFVSLMICGWLIVINYVKGCLVKYEACQPENVIAKIAGQLSSGELGDELSFGIGSRFESSDTAKNNYLSSLSGKEITFEKKASSSSTNPSYTLYAGTNPIAVVSLIQTSNEPMMAILSEQTWDIESVSPVYESGDTAVTVYAPTGYTVYINGTAADDRELVDGAIEIDDFENVKEYTEVPTMCQYKIEGLMFTPEVKITNASGQEVAVSLEGATYTAEFQSTDIPADIESLVLKYAKDYTNFFSGDLAGCYTSINCLRPMFTSNSYFLAPAEIYRCEDMGFYSAHTEPVFSNEVVSNYTPINDNFFYVDVYFEKLMHLTRTGEDHTDYNNQRYYYVKENGNWVIADMKQNLD